jgi:hypothetical protein
MTPAGQTPHAVPDGPSGRELQNNMISLRFDSSKRRRTYAACEGVAIIAAGLALAIPCSAQFLPTEVGVQANTGGWILQSSNQVGNVSVTQESPSGTSPEIAGNTVASASLSESVSGGGSTASLRQTYTAQIGSLSGTTSGAASSVPIGAAFSATSYQDAELNSQPGGAYFTDFITIDNPSLAIGAEVPITLTQVANWNAAASLTGDAEDQVTALFQLWTAGPFVSVGGTGEFGDQPPGNDNYLDGSESINVFNGYTYGVEGLLLNGGTTIGSNGGSGSYSDNVSVNDYLSSSLLGTTITSDSGHNYSETVPDNGMTAAMLGLSLTALVCFAGQIRRPRLGRH